MSKKNRELRLVWLDMEMTGLDPYKDKIIEVACVITDINLEIIEVGPEFVIRRDASLFAGMDDWNRKHHSDSGLWEKVVNTGIHEREAFDRTLSFIKKFVAKRKGLLAGNSVWQDRRFIEQAWPELLDYLHYRILDVSGIKTLAQNWYQNIRFEKRESHRAMDDVKESLEELKYYRDKIFLPISN